MTLELPARLPRVCLTACAVAAAMLQACGGGSEDSAAAPTTLAECLGIQAQVTPGVTMNFALRYTLSNAQGESASQDQAGTQYVNQGVVFDGAARTEFVREITLTSPGGTQLQTVDRVYLAADSATRLTVYGGVTRAVSTSADRTLVREVREVDIPPTMHDYSAGIGTPVSTTSTKMRTVTTTLNGVVEPGSTSPLTTTEKKTFAGIESITVPAGTYRTCRIEDDDTVIWMIPGTGVYARSEFRIQGLLERTELLSLTRNGTRL